MVAEAVLGSVSSPRFTAKSRLHCVQIFERRSALKEGLQHTHVLHWLRRYGKKLGDRKFVQWWTGALTTTEAPIVWGARELVSTSEGLDPQLSNHNSIAGNNVLRKLLLGSCSY